MQNFIFNALARDNLIFIDSLTGRKYRSDSDLYEVTDYFFSFSEVIIYLRPFFLCCGKSSFIAISSFVSLRFLIMVTRFLTAFLVVALSIVNNFNDIFCFLNKVS